MRKLLLAAFLLAPLTSFAIDFTTPMLQLDGKPVLDKDGGGISLSSIVENALLSPYTDEAALAGEEKIKRYLLATKVHDAANTHQQPVFTSDEVTLIKKLVAKSYTPLIVGQVWKLLDPASVPEGNPR